MCRTDLIPAVWKSRDDRTDVAVACQVLIVSACREPARLVCRDWAMTEQVWICGTLLSVANALLSPTLVVGPFACFHVLLTAVVTGTVPFATLATFAFATFAFSSAAFSFSFAFYPKVVANERTLPRSHEAILVFWHLI